MVFKKISKLLLIEQTFFALPFAYLGLLFAGGDEIYTWIWVTLALVSARIAGMSYNRVIDANIDAKNPRTKDRAIPSGEISKLVVWLIAVLASIIFISSAFMLNEICFYLSFIALFMLFTYSYIKRFSSTSHFYLGLVEAAAPIGGYLAVITRFDVVPFLLGAAIMLWITGLDIVYAIQDHDFDKDEGLNSIPVRFGKDKALMISLILYIISIIMLIAAGVLTSRGISYWVSVICVILIFFRQQYIARKEDIEIAIVDFFQINTLVSPILFVGTFIDVMIK
ncbi:MAG: UbiA-like polyprenyltransferase [Spirochaetota bacterium]|nr:UbiA-like polyprenyltransferase [Spirochaetota bacterium]